MGFGDAGTHRNERYALSSAPLSGRFRHSRPAAQDGVCWRHPAGGKNHLGHRDYLAERTRVLPFAAFCRELNLP